MLTASGPNVDLTSSDEEAVPMSITPQVSTAIDPSTLSGERRESSGRTPIPQVL